MIHILAATALVPSSLCAPLSPGVNALVAPRPTSPPLSTFLLILVDSDSRLSY